MERTYQCAIGHVTLPMFCHWLERDWGWQIFDTPGYNETLFLYCHEDGLKGNAITAKDAAALIKLSGDKPTRGLAIKMHERKEKIEAKLPSDKKGRFAQTFLTFNVNPR